MIRFALILGFAAVLLAGAVPARADDHPEFAIGPWRLGMSRDEVAAFGDRGPYEAVASTGGVETRHAGLDHHVDNVSFHFDDDRVDYIQTWYYEGPDAAGARAAAMELYDELASRLGGLTVRNMEIGKKNDVSREGFGVFVDRIFGTSDQVVDDIRKKDKKNSHVVVTITFDLIPNQQPEDYRIHAQLVYSGRHHAYYVLLFQDLKGAPSREVKANVMLEKE